MERLVIGALGAYRTARPSSLAVILASVAAAIAFARKGADVAINYLPSEEEDAKYVITLIEQKGHKAIALPGDVSNEKFCRKLVKEAHKKLGGLNILACVAGK
jgi:NAD(P)-dependent dehydrogenase (short-subunit alcohol dehydrogenase family)